MNIPTITPRALAELLRQEKKVTLIDVRTPVEFRAGHLENAHNIPLDQVTLTSLEEVRNGSSADPTYLICRSGGRAKHACERLLAQGASNVINVEGGTMACAEAGFPLIREGNAISLERQVRIVSGSLVLIGVVLGWMMHEAFFGISAFVGAGLVVAGVTDTCGMGMLLARMPWNQSANPSGV